VTARILPLFLSLGLAPTCNRNPSDPVLLSLGDQVVKRSDFDRHLAALEAKGGGPLPADVRGAFLQPFLEERALVLEARSRGMLSAGSSPEEEQAAVQRLLGDAVLGHAIASEEEVAAYFKEHSAELRVPEKVWLRQILVPTENEARDVRRRLQKDPMSFEALARTLSRSPEASTGGVMGAFARGELPAELEKVAFALNPRASSDVARTSLGWHVLRVDRREAGREPTLEESRERIRSEIVRRKSDEAWRQFVRALMARAKVNHEIAEPPPPGS
jgi:parvulin-like peptidyl-prolyl cis-trans isomerase-like protein